MNNTEKIRQAESRKQYLLKEIVRLESEIEQLRLTDDDTLLQTYDFDCDGKISLIDYCILADAILNRNHSSLYNALNRTFNGKSLDLIKDLNINVIDFNGFANTVLEYLGSAVPIDLVRVSFFKYEKNNFNGTDWVLDYCNNHNGNYPTLDELKAAYNAA